MKKIIITLAALAAAFSMASCGKVQFVESENTPAEGSCIVTASTEGSLTKTSLSGDDTKGYEVVWSEGDTFILGGETFSLVKGAGTSSGTFQGYISVLNGPHKVFYPASYDGSSWPVKQTYTEGNITGSPMTADVYCILGAIEGGKVEFKNVGGILRLTVKGSPSASITSITLYADNTPDYLLDCGTGVALDDTDGTVFHIAMPEGTYTGVSIQFNTANNKFCVKTLKSDLVINRSEITPASIKIDEFRSFAPDGALPETFTVSAEGRKVYFSKGNLYWDGSNHKFEVNQYDHDDAAGHQSSFFWSNTAEYARGAEWDLDQNAPIVFFTNADKITANPDFTANGQTGLWRALSKDEWIHLINRENGIGEATINGVKGVIIFYDEYDGQTDGLTSIPEGCVFLPASEKELGTVGFYWSSSPSPEYESSYIPSSAGLRYTEGAWPPSVVLDGMPEKNTVRLVTDVPDSPTPAFTVTFDMNGMTGAAPADYTDVPLLTTITKPTDPEVDALYALRGWFKDKTCTDEWDFGYDVVTRDITLYAKWYIKDALSGLFTVDGNGKKVYFSKGNLWYGKTSEGADSATFNFEENQYDYGAVWDPYLRNYYQDGNHISRFLWSKNPDVACALIYDDPSTSVNDQFFTNATETTPNPNFTIDGQKGLWRTLSIQEWEYFMENSGSVWATINGVGGRIFFCDEYSGEKEGEFTEIPEGCLFLPATGYRGNYSDKALIYHKDFAGCYWSAFASEPYMSQFAYGAYFNPDGIGPFTNNTRDNGYAVRLVLDITE